MLNNGKPKFGTALFTLACPMDLLQYAQLFLSFPIATLN